MNNLELVVLIVVVLVALVLVWRGFSLTRLVGNAIIGVVLLFLTNLVLHNDIPINLLTVLVCAIGGVGGWLAVLASLSTYLCRSVLASHRLTPGSFGAPALLPALIRRSAWRNCLKRGSRASVPLP